MVVTFEDLERRLTVVERELAMWRLANAKASAPRGLQLLEVSAFEQQQINAAWDEVMQKLGISGEPIGAEKARVMIEAEGVKPENNEFSRGIIEMREE